MKYSFKIAIPSYGEINDRTGSYCVDTPERARASAHVWLAQNLSKIAPGYTPADWGPYVHGPRIADCDITVLEFED